MSLSHAVVLGASVAGLLSATALSKSFDTVTIVERDQLADDAVTRRGVPQGHQVHQLMPAGLMRIEELLPGFGDELLEQGCERYEIDRDVAVLYPLGWAVRVAGGMDVIGFLRPTFEWVLRRRVLALPNVRAVHGIATGLLADADGTAVTGVKVTGVDGEKLDADLVVDATGRGSRTPVWLEELGYPRVPEERKKIGLGYVTQHYKLLADPYDGDLSINPVAFPEVPRGAIFTKTDGGRVELTTYGLLGDHPPTDQEGLYAWVKSLAVPDIHDALQNAVPLDEPVAFRFPTTLRRRYEDLDRFPQGLLVTGDAVTTFNPVYAQGMTVAALGALTIRDHLHTGAAPVPAQYFRDLARDVIDPAWEMTNTVDLTFPGVQGERTPQVRAAQVFLKLVQKAATRDGKVTAAYMRGAGLVDKPDAMKRPAFVARVLWNVVCGAVGERLRSRPGPRPGARPGPGTASASPADSRSEDLVSAG